MGVPARERSRQKVFVFVAGDQGTPDEYSRLEREKRNLPMFATEATAAQNEKLKKFRKILTEKHAGFFKNIDDFQRSSN